MSSQDFDINAAIRPQNTTTPDSQPQFGIQRIYIKDLSFEAPHAPDIFRTDWTPDVNLDLDTGISQVSDDVYEVVLKVTVTVKAKEKTAFLIEVKQAGIFSIKSFPSHQLQPTLASYCPNILFPYAREVISDIVNRGTFPPLYLAPVNFDVLYQQYLAQQKPGQNQQKPAEPHKEPLEEV